MHISLLNKHATWHKTGIKTKTTPSWEPARNAKGHSINIMTDKNKKTKPLNSGAQRKNPAGPVKNALVPSAGKNLVKYDPLQRYLKEISKYRLLTRDEEIELEVKDYLTPFEVEQLKAIEKYAPESFWESMTTQSLSDAMKPSTDEREVA